MMAMGKQAFIAALSVVSLLLFSLVTGLHFSVAQTGTQESGIISQNTTWTKASSPYSLTGNVLVFSGVNLSIESGVAINLDGYYIMVNGTLQARGTAIDQITFNGPGSLYGSLILNSNTLGTEIENTSFYSGGIVVNSGSPKIVSSAILGGIDVNGGSAIISSNTIKNGAYVHSGSPTISNNNVLGTISIQGGSASVLNNVISGGNGNNQGILVQESSAEISNNIVDDGIYLVRFDRTEISSNTIKGEISLNGGQADILNNTISDGNYGISINQDAYFDNNVNIQDNVILNCSKAGIYGIGGTNMGVFGATHSSATIQRNLIQKNGYGIQLSLDSETIHGNTIANNTVGINGLSSSSYSIIYNNIQNNGQNVRAGYNNFTVISNWWGSMDVQTINQSIYDFKNDFTLGTVMFVPFLTEPNAQALPNPDVALSTLTPNSTQSPSPSLTSSPGSSPTPTFSPSPSPTQQPTTEPSPTTSPTPIAEAGNPNLTLEIAGAVAIAIVVVMLLVYFRKRAG